LVERILCRLQILFNNGLRISYHKTWKKVLKSEKLSEDAYAGVFIDWDNTARQKRGYTMLVGEKHFEVYFQKQYIKAVNNNSPFIFINAWNEWGEGTYLEPDKKNGVFFLEAIKSVLNSNS
jgi:hypothetical protein